MVSNREISRLFRLYAELLLLHQKNELLAALLSGAAYRIRRITDQLTTLSKEELLKLFRPEITSLIETLKNTGTIETLNELIELTPGGLFEMMRIRGLGGKKLAVLWKTAKIDTLETLLDACKNQELNTIPGFGAKTQQNIIDSIENYRSNLDHFHYSSVADQANHLIKVLQQTFKTTLISICGEVRRQSTTVAGIEIIMALPSKKLKEKNVRRFIIINSYGSKETKGHTLDEIPVTFYHTTKDRFYLELFQHTGNKIHVKKVLDKIKSKGLYTSEELIYKKAGLPYILPEMREDVAEWDFKKDIDSLVRMEDIRGVVHNHTTWSDGVDTLSDFVKACKNRKYEYCVISDHSKNAHYAGGLKEEKVLRQLQEIDKLNKLFAPFRIFKSIECDILVSGELDYDSDLLKRFDLVIVSVHQLLKMDEERATKRLISAIEKN